VHNFLILCIQILCIGTFSLVALRIGEKALNAWLCVLALGMNIFVLKQITLFGWDVTGTDALTVGYILGLSLIQEYYGSRAARMHVGMAFLISLGFILLSYIQLAYHPNAYDSAHSHLCFIFIPLPRILGASLLSFLLVQLVDIRIFSVLRRKFKGRLFAARAGMCCLFSQILDTIFFSFVGLYGLVENIGHIILLSLFLKIFITFISTPFLSLSYLFTAIPRREKDTTRTCPSA